VTIRAGAGSLEQAGPRSRMLRSSDTSRPVVGHSGTFEEVVDLTGDRGAVRIERLPLMHFAASAGRRATGEFSAEPDRATMPHENRGSRRRSLGYRRPNGGDREADNQVPDLPWSGVRTGSGVAEADVVRLVVLV